MKKILSLILLLGTMMVFTTETPWAASPEVLRVTTWGGNYKDTYESVIGLFEKDIRTLAAAAGPISVQ